MAITCPACNKADQGDSTCARCGCDLSQLWMVVIAAATSLAEGQAALRACNWPNALSRAQASWSLCHSVEAARLAFLAACALGQTAAALRWREHSQSPSAKS